MFGLVSLAACGGQPVAEPLITESTSAAPPAVTLTIAESVVDRLPELWAAWRGPDCAKIESMTAWAEAEFAANVCDSMTKGRRTPDHPDYAEMEIFLPGSSEDGAWFAALARKPDPAYFVFAYDESKWRLAYGPLPLIEKVPKEDTVPSGAAEMIVKARLVPQQYLTYLTDPAGVTGIVFPAGDAMRALKSELARSRVKVRPDRLSVDVRLATDSSRSLLLSDGGSLVFHAITLVFTQKPGPDRKALRHPRYSSADVRAFTGKTKPDSLTGSETIFLATRVSSAGKMSTIGLRRELARITAG